MTADEYDNYTVALGCLWKIAEGYYSPEELREAPEYEGLDYEEVLTMAYENIQADAKRVLARIDQPATREG